VVAPLTLGLFVWAIIRLFSAFGTDEIGTASFQFLIALVLLILPLLARLYALKNQDRIIRMEMRQRYYELTGKPLRVLEEKLRLSQLIALRFASDEELIDLINETISKDLRAKEIKMKIKNWQEDKRRV
jgi:hypothetical protein